MSPAVKWYTPALNHNASDKNQMKVSCCCEICLNVWCCVLPRAMDTKELPKKLEDLIIERYQSGEECDRILKALNEPTLSKPLSISGQNVAPQRHCKRPGWSSIVDGRMTRNPMMEVTRRPTATLKELQEFLGATARSLHVTISSILNKSEMWSRMAGWETFLTKSNMQVHLNYSK